MSGGKGGGGSSSKSTTTIKQSKPSPVVLPDGPFPGLGFNLPANPAQMGTPATGQGLAPPAWAAPGSPFAMDWWGQQAPNVGAALLQQEQWGPWAPASPAPPPTTPGDTTGGCTKPAADAGRDAWRAYTNCLAGSSGSTGGKSSSKASRQPSGGKASGTDDLMARSYQEPYNWASHGTQG